MAIHWSCPSRSCDLTDQQVHLWLIYIPDFLSTVNDDFLLLDLHEQRRANAFKFKKDSDSFVVSHAALRKILSQYCDRSSQALQFNLNQYKKPYLTNVNDHDIQFNLSHSHDYALVGVTQRDEIGTDIEYMRKTRDLDQIAERFFAEGEFHEYLQLTEEQKYQGFYNAWTRKEAFIKAIGFGLHFSLKDFVVSLSPGIEAKIVDIKNGKFQSYQWQLEGFLPANDYCAAVVYHGKEKYIRYFCY